MSDMGAENLRGLPEEYQTDIGELPPDQVIQGGSGLSEPMQEGSHAGRNVSIATATTIALALSAYGANEILSSEGDGDSSDRGKLPNPIESSTPESFQPTATEERYDAATNTYIVPTETPTQEPTATHAPSPTETPTPEPTPTATESEVEYWDGDFDFQFIVDSETIPELANTQLMTNPVYERVDQYGETIDGEQALHDLILRIHAQAEYASIHKRGTEFNIEEVNNIDYRAFEERMLNEDVKYSILAHREVDPETGETVDPETGMPIWQKDQKVEELEVDPTEGLEFKLIANQDLLNQRDDEDYYEGNVYMSEYLQARLSVNEEGRLRINVIIDHTKILPENGVFSVNKYGTIFLQGDVLMAGEYIKHWDIQQGRSGGIKDEELDNIHRDMIFNPAGSDVEVDGVNVVDFDAAGTFEPLLVPEPVQE